MSLYRPATLFDDLEELFAVPVARRRNISQGFMPKLDVYESKDKLVFQFDLPGLRKDQIDVSLHDNVLTVSGKYDEHKAPASTPSSNGKEKEHAHVADDRHYKVRERATGTFSRSMPVPNGLAPSEVETKLENGVLTLTVPSAPKESQAKKIVIA